MLADDDDIVLARDRPLLQRITRARAEKRSLRVEDAHQLGATTGGETIVRMCTSKKSWFRTEAEAAKAADDCTAKYNERFYTYRCRACNDWHLTTRRPGTMRP